MKHLSLALWATLAIACGGNVSHEFLGGSSGTSASAGGAAGTGGASSAGGVAGTDCTTDAQCAPIGDLCQTCSNGVACRSPRCDAGRCVVQAPECPIGGPAVDGGGGTGGGSVCNTACLAPSECTLVLNNCCACGVPSLSQYTAVNGSSKSTCGYSGSCCQCAGGLNPNLAATCSTSWVCTAFDVSKVDAYSSCQSDLDCTLRAGLTCCEPCHSDGSDLVAVNVDQSALKAALCWATFGCDTCVRLYPVDKQAVCVANHCQVQ